MEAKRGKKGDSLFDCLPPELLVAIFVKLDVSEITSSISLVCRQWKDVALDPTLWRQVCLRFGFWEAAQVKNQPKDWKEYFRDMSQFIWGIEKKDLTFTGKIGEGTHSKVFSGYYRGHPVALRVIKKKDWNLLDLRAIEARFRYIAKMRHPNVVSVYGVCISPITREGFPPRTLSSEQEKGDFNVIVVTELCHKGSLHAHLLQLAEEPQRIQEAQRSLYRIAADVVRGVQYLHTWRPKQAWVVGAHLSIHAVLLDKDLHAKIMPYFNDFISDAESIEMDDNQQDLDALILQHFDSGQGVLRGVYGRLRYAAPEVYFGRKETIQSDSYAIGFLLWEIATVIASGGYSKPYSEYSLPFDFQILKKAAEHELRPSFHRGIPSSLQALISSCWSASPNNRPSLSDISLFLAQFILELP